MGDTNELPPLPVNYAPLGGEDFARVNREIYIHHQTYHAMGDYSREEIMRAALWANTRAAYHIFITPYINVDEDDERGKEERREGLKQWAAFIDGDGYFPRTDAQKEALKIG